MSLIFMLLLYIIAWYMNTIWTFYIFWTISFVAVLGCYSTKHLHKGGDKK